MSQPKLDRITQDPNVLDGLPTIRDTGITVSEVVKAMMGGKTADDFLAEYPQLDGEDVMQALLWAVDDLFHEIQVLLMDVRNPINSLHGFCKYIAEDDEVVLDHQIRETASEITLGGEFVSERLISTFRRLRSNYYVQQPE